MCDHEDGFDCCDWKEIGLVAVFANEISDEELEKKTAIRGSPTGGG